MALMCQGQLDFDAVEAAHLLDFRSYFAKELEELKPLADQGLVQIDASSIEVTPQGWFFVRAVAMVFDRYLQSDRTRARFSKII